MGLIEVFSDQQLFMASDLFRLINREKHLQVMSRSIPETFIRQILLNHHPLKTFDVTLMDLSDEGVEFYLT